MATRDDIDLYKNIGESPEELRQALIALRAEFEARKDSDFQKLVSLVVSNISISAGGPDDPIGTIGRDPKSQNIWGYIAERGYGFHARYLGANYARFFVDATNDLNHSTPSVIIDMPSPNKMVFKDNESHTIIRLYGRGGQEVGFAANNFAGYGAFDLFCPMRLFTFDYGSGTAGGPETFPGYLQDGFMYLRQNYGSTNLSDIRVFVDGLWRSVSLNQQGTKYSRDLTNEPVAEHIAVREVVTVTIT
jgi:hypothetical protein